MTAINELMPIDYLDDWDKRIERQDAFWDCAIIDRPVVEMRIAKNNPAYPKPAEKTFASHKERWLDCDYVAENALHEVMNTDYLGDALPRAFPNIGPDVFAAYFGLEMDYEASTAWARHALKEWKDIDQFQFSEDNFYWKKTREMTDALIEIGKGKFYTGHTDLHPGGDALAAMRDPMNLNFDVIDYEDEVIAAVDRITTDFCGIYDKLQGHLTENGQPCSHYTHIVSSLRWQILACDFSAMISPDMFDELFLPGLRREAQHMDHTLFHVDGPGVLRHLDTILTIPEFSAIEWVPGVGNGNPPDWIETYQKIQAAGKGLNSTSISANSKR